MRTRDLDIVPASTQRGILALSNRALDSNWLAREFPDRCPDGNGVAGTDRSAALDTLRALVPDLLWPPSVDDAPATEVILDLVDFVAQRVAWPVEGAHHSLFGHHELTFDVARGKSTFWNDVNQLFPAEAWPANWGRMRK